MIPLLDRLVQGLDAKRNGAGWKALCPAHADNSPSLGLSERDGKVLFRCYAGCEQADVLAALRERGLWPDAAAQAARPLPAAVAPVAPVANGAPTETRYEYRDAAGALLAMHKRTDLGDGKKAFSWLAPDGTPSNGRVRVADLPLFGAEQLRDTPADSWVVLTEGEKAARAARALGLRAVSLPGGASQADFGTALEALRQRRVALWPDNDAPGRALMSRVQAALKGVAAQTIVLDVPDLPEKGDAFDFAAAGRKGSEIIALIERALGAGQPRTWSAAALLAEQFAPPQVIVQGVLHEGAMLLAGRPKTGKSFLALGTAVALACGGRALGTIPVEAGGVLYLALEDGPRRVQERLGLLLGDAPPPGWLTLATEWPRLDEGGLEAIEFWLAGHPSAHLVVIDTLKRLRPAGQDVRRQLYDLDYESVAPLTDLAHRYGVCILIVHHTRKAEADDPMDLVSGTLGLTGAVDGAIVLQRKRGSTNATLWVTHRDAEDSELAIRWDAQATGWLLLGDAETERESEERAEVLGVLEESGEALYPREVADALGKGNGTVRRLLWSMVRAGQARTVSGRYLSTGAGARVAKGGRPRSGAKPPLTAKTVTPPDGTGSKVVTVRSSRPPHWANDVPDETTRGNAQSNATGASPNLVDGPGDTTLPHFTDSDPPPISNDTWSGPEPEPPWPRGGRQPP